MLKVVKGLHNSGGGFLACPPVGGDRHRKPAGAIAERPDASVAVEKVGERGGRELLFGAGHFDVQHSMERAKSRVPLDAERAAFNALNRGF